jgi:predicted Zn-dependent protease
MFARMGESFAANPAAGFPNFLGELARLEGPALDGVTLAPAEERALGRRARDDYLARMARAGYPVERDPRKLGYVQALVDRLARRMDHRARYPKLDVTLIRAAIPDGQSFPGGYLAFTTGLLDEPDEATVVGVVAHELAHLDRGHQYQYARRGKLAESAFDPRSFAGAPGPAQFDRMMTRGMAALGVMMNPFRPEHEHEADCTAALWMFLEGDDPAALSAFFARMNRRQNDAPANPFWPIGRSHPYTLDRKAHMDARRADLRRWRPRQDLGLHPEALRALTPHAAPPPPDAPKPAPR